MKSFHYFEDRLTEVNYKQWHTLSNTRELVEIQTSFAEHVTAFCTVFSWLQCELT